MKRARDGMVQSRVCALQFLPAPVLKLQKSFRLPRSPLSLRLRYEVPLEAIEDFYRPPARLLVRCAPHTHTTSPMQSVLLKCGSGRNSVAEKEYSA